MTREDKAAYEALKMLGHSPVKALEIILDRRRGDEFAWDWIEAASHDEDERVRP